MTQYEVAAYYFPQYHQDPRNDVWHGPGWTEWQLLQAATPRFHGHRQPITPAWGYFDEAAPAWAARQIDLAADHGITTFLFDWYWYDGQPFLQGALERGFLQAPNCARLKFALMWANHDWVNLFPARYTNIPEVLASGKVTPVGFAHMTAYVIEHYFMQSNYLTVDGAPFYTIYDLGNFIAGMGGVRATAEALQMFRADARRAGFPDVHLNAILPESHILPGETTFTNPEAIIADLGFSSVGSYVWMHHDNLAAHGFPLSNYAKVAEANYRTWEEQLTRFGLPYFPNVTVGWDSSPRTAQSDIFSPHDYPWLPVLAGNTPAAFQTALEHARSFVDQHLATTKLITLNAWNEWTEGSYLLPDTQTGTAYLQKIRAVFGALVPPDVSVPD